MLFLSKYKAVGDLWSSKDKLENRYIIEVELSV